MQHIPEHWKCDLCFKCKICGTRKYYNEEDAMNAQPSVDNQMSKTFSSLCYKCGLDESKKLECSICQKKTTALMNKNLETMRCRECGLYSHISCSRVDLE